MLGTVQLSRGLVFAGEPKGVATAVADFMPKRPSPLKPEEPAEPQPPGPDLPPVKEPPSEEPDVDPVKPVQDPLRDPVQPPPRMITSAERRETGGAPRAVWTINIGKEPS